MRRHVPGVRSSVPAAALALVCLAAPAPADVDLTMIPERDEVEMVVYGNQDVTIVRDRRTIGLQTGPNNIVFTWADTRIDPTSIKIRSVAAPDKVLIRKATYPPNRENTLVWTIEATEAADYLMEVSYFTAGITWAPHYRVIANDDESRLQLYGAIELVNGSGEDYDSAQAKLVVGDLHLVQAVAELAQAGRAYVTVGLGAATRLAVGGGPALRRAAEEPEAEDRAKAPPAIGMAGIGEYFIYTIEGTHDINDGWRSRFAAISGPDVPVRVLHKYEPNWGGVRKFYRFRNDAPATLGNTPLARGATYVLRTRTAQGLTPVATTEMPYGPIGEEVELDVGPDALVVVERTLMDYKKLELTFDRYDRVSGWDTEEAYTVDVRNRSEKAVEIEVFEHIGGVWEISTDAPYEKVDKDTVKFPLTLASQTTKTIEFRISKHHGKNAEPD